MSDELDRLVLAVDELTQPRQTVSRVGYWDRSRHKKFRVHVVTHAPLLKELADAISPRYEGEGGRSAPGSRPPLRLDAIDAERAIGRGVLEWLERLALESRSVLAFDLRQLVGMAPLLPESVLVKLVSNAMGWTTLAKVVTGFEAPAFRPRAACPLCSESGSLRVRAETASAACVACGAGWRKSDATIFVLAEHIRLTNGESESA